MRFKNCLNFFFRELTSCCELTNGNFSLQELQTRDKVKEAELKQKKLPPSQPSSSAQGTTSQKSALRGSTATVGPQPDVGSAGRLPLKEIGANKSTSQIASVSLIEILGPATSYSGNQPRTRSSVTAGVSSLVPVAEGLGKGAGLVSATFPVLQRAVSSPQVTSVGNLSNRAGTAQASISTVAGTVIAANSQTKGTGESQKTALPTATSTLTATNCAPSGSRGSIPHVLRNNNKPQSLISLPQVQKPSVTTSTPSGSGQNSVETCIG